VTQPTTDPLRNLVDRAEHHGGLTGNEATALRDGIAQLYAQIETLEQQQAACAHIMEKADDDWNELVAASRLYKAHAAQTQTWGEQQQARANRYRERFRVQRQRAERAERAEAALNAIRAAVHIADPDDLTDWQRGYRACSNRAIAVLDAHTNPKDQAPAAHTGSNAEDCPACEGTNPPYPFICPGPTTKEH
jgi:hypothetical protein